MKKNQKGFTLTELMVCLALLLQLAVVGGIIYVAVHFITKFW